MSKFITSIVTFSMLYTINYLLLFSNTNQECKIIKINNVGYSIDCSYRNRINLPVLPKNISKHVVALQLHGSGITNVSLNILEEFKDTLKVLSLGGIKFPCDCSISLLWKDYFGVEEFLPRDLIGFHTTNNTLDNGWKLPKKFPKMKCFDKKEKVWKLFEKINLYHCKEKYFPKGSKPNVKWKKFIINRMSVEVFLENVRSLLSKYMPHYNGTEDAGASFLKSLLVEIIATVCFMLLVYLIKCMWGIREIKHRKEKRYKSKTDSTTLQQKESPILQTCSLDTLPDNNTLPDNSKENKLKARVAYSNADFSPEQDVVTTTQSRGRHVRNGDDHIENLRVEKAQKTDKELLRNMNKATKNTSSNPPSYEKEDNLTRVISGPKSFVKDKVMPSQSITSVRSKVNFYQQGIDNNVKQYSPKNVRNKNNPESPHVLKNTLHSTASEDFKSKITLFQHVSEDSSDRGVEKNLQKTRKSFDNTHKPVSLINSLKHQKADEMNNADGTDASNSKDSEVIEKIMLPIDQPNIGHEVADPNHGRCLKNNENHLTTCINKMEMQGIDSNVKHYSLKNVRNKNNPESPHVLKNTLHSTASEDFKSKITLFQHVSEDSSDRGVEKNLQKTRKSFDNTHKPVSLINSLKHQKADEMNSADGTDASNSKDSEVIEKIMLPVDQPNIGHEVADPNHGRCLKNNENHLTTCINKLEIQGSGEESQLNLEKIHNREYKLPTGNAPILTGEKEAVNPSDVTEQLQEKSESTKTSRTTSIIDTNPATNSTATLFSDVNLEMKKSNSNEILTRELSIVSTIKSSPSVAERDVQAALLGSAMQCQVPGLAHSEPSHNKADANHSDADSTNAVKTESLKSKLSKLSRLYSNGTESDVNNDPLHGDYISQSNGISRLTENEKKNIASCYKPRNSEVVKTTFESTFDEEVDSTYFVRAGSLKSKLSNLSRLYKDCC